MTSDINNPALSCRAFRRHHKRTAVEQYVSLSVTSDELVQSTLTNSCVDGDLVTRGAVWLRSLYPTATDISAQVSEFACTYHVTDSARIRLPGFCHWWSVRLEQSPGSCPQSELHRSCFQAPANDIFVRTLIARSEGCHGGGGGIRRCVMHWHWLDMFTHWWHT